MAEIAECADLDILEPTAVSEFATAQAIDFAIIGPEAPLVAGVSDALRAAGILCFGPSQAAAARFWLWTASDSTDNFLAWIR